MKRERTKKRAVVTTKKGKNGTEKGEKQNDVKRKAMHVKAAPWPLQ